MMEPAEHEAIDWLIRLSGSSTSDVDIVIWQEWLATSETNRTAYARIEEIWQLAMHLGGDNSAIDFGLAEFKRDIPREPERPTLLNANVLPRRQNQSNRSSFKNRAILISGSAAIIAATIAVWQVSFQWPNSLPKIGRESLQVFETAAAQHREFGLVDGSRVSMGAESLVSISYTKDFRSAVLKRGEAYFEVAENKSRPFVVHAGSRLIRAVGTAFNVSMRKDLVTVTVTEGTVVVSANETVPYGESGGVSESSQLAQVTAGQEVKYDANFAELSVRPANVAAAVAWRNGTLRYVGESLGRVIEDVNRYSDQDIYLDEEIRQVRFTGTVFQDSVDDWLAGLEIALPVNVDRNPDGSIFVRPDGADH